MHNTTAALFVYDFALAVEWLSQIIDAGSLAGWNINSGIKLELNAICY
jgi:hypothetical protein